MPQADSIHTPHTADSLVTDSLAMDSLARDSVQRAMAAPVQRVRKYVVKEWTKGLEPMPLPGRADNNSAIISSLVVLLLLLLVCLQRGRRLLPALFRDMWRVRSRKKIFEERTSNENRIITIFGLQLTVFMALLVNAGADLMAGQPPLSDSAALLLPIVALCGAFYLLQIITYWCVGYAFTTSSGRKMWLRGFYAVQTFLGFGLAIPALVTVFYPDAAGLAVTIGAILYIFSRIVFISKGFRIFYQNYWSLLYFILYLCTLEITPLVIIYRTAASFSL